MLYSDWVDESSEKDNVLADIKDYFDRPSEFLANLNTAMPARKTSRIEAEPTIQVLDQTAPVSNEDGNDISQESKTPFKDILKFEVNGETDLVISLMDNDQVIWINEYRKAGSYIGFTQKGVGFGRKDLDTFLKHSALTLKSGQTTSVPWKGKGNSKLIIQDAGNDMVDLRLFVESSKYTGFTKKGFRLSKAQYTELLKLIAEGLL